MKNYIGIAIIMLGAILLVACYLEPTGAMVDSNIFPLAGVAAIVAGIVAHVQILKRAK